MASSATERILDMVQGRCPRLPRNAAAQYFRTALARLAQDTESWRCRIPLAPPPAPRSSYPPSGLWLPPLRVNARYGRVVILREPGGRPLCRAHRNGAELSPAEPWRIPPGAQLVAEVSLYPSEEGPCDMPDEVLQDLAPAVTEYAVHLAASTAHSAWTDAATASDAYARYARELSRLLVTAARDATGMVARTALPLIERNA